ncbi:hypothetical protein TRICI_001352 [Trichomonascus ciferrii]|uniref:DUF3835 domain-containing protein n=1 Tax=Trichomonascus ciferrii TaxID=44093 RepID=A0A642V9W3_9ASCO|nr:hypothetical protein TRICI_001352 [Trichomonascus ciferrii]
MALAPLRDRINQKILGLEFHLSYVENKEREFLDVERTLSQEPEILVVNDRVKLFVGDGWFIEQSVEDSLGFVRRRLHKLGEEITQINNNLDSARKAVADLEKLDFDEDVQKETKNDGLDDYTTPEGLPMMDIHEELDEEGNVVSASVEPQKKDHDLKEFAEKHLTRLIQQREEDIKNERSGANSNQNEEYDSEGYKLIGGKRVYGPPRPPSEEEVPKDEKAQSQPKSILKKSNNSESSSRSMDKPPESMKRFMGLKEGKIPQESGRISEVTEEDDNTKNQSHSKGGDVQEKPSSDSIDRSKNHNQDEVSVIDPVKKMSESVKQQSLNHHHHSIDTEDLLQLELIANDLTKNEEDMHFDGVDWEFEEDYEEDDDDEEEDEYGRSSIGYERLTLEEVEKRTKAAEAAALEAKNNRPSPDSAGKKQVRFASEVEINRFDKTRVAQSDSHIESGVLAPGNEPESELETKKKKRVSRFKAERMENKNNFAPSVGWENVVPVVGEQGPVKRGNSAAQAESMDKVIEENFVESASPVKSTVIEGTPIDAIKERQGPVGDIQEKNEPLESNMVGPVGDVKESVAIEQTVINDSTGPLTAEITEKNGPVGDIMERAPPVNEAKSVSKEDKTSLPSQSQTNEPSRRNIFSISPNAPTPSRNQKIPPALLRQPEKLKHVKAQAPTPIPGMEGEQTIVPLEISEEQQISDTVENVASTMKPQDVFSKEVYDLAKEHFKNAVVTEEQFIQAHDRDSGDEDEEPLQEQENPDSRPILSTNIQENPTSTPVPPSFLDAMDDSDSDEDFSVSMAEISTEYHRIRNKLIQKTGGFKQSDAEREFESLDENGNPIKVSRFKAARLSNRSI